MKTKTAEEIKQEFKELNAYLDDLYNNHKSICVRRA